MWRTHATKIMCALKANDLFRGEIRERSELSKFYPFFSPHSGLLTPWNAWVQLWLMPEIKCLCVEVMSKSSDRTEISLGTSWPQYFLTRGFHLAKVSTYMEDEEQSTLTRWSLDNLLNGGWIDILNGGWLDIVGYESQTICSQELSSLSELSLEDLIERNQIG